MQTRLNRSCNHVTNPGSDARRISKATIIRSNYLRRCSEHLPKSFWWDRQRARMGPSKSPGLPGQTGDILIRHQKYVTGIHTRRSLEWRAHTNTGEINKLENGGNVKWGVDDNGSRSTPLSAALLGRKRSRWVLRIPRDSPTPTHTNTPAPITVPARTTAGASHRVNACSQPQS